MNSEDFKKKPDDGFTQANTTQDVQRNLEQIQSRSTEQPSGFAIAGLVCGILSIVCCCVWYISGILGILGLVFSIMVLVKKLPGKSLAIAGAICAGIGVILAIIMMVIVLSVTHSLSSMSPEELRSLLETIENMD